MYQKRTTNAVLELSREKTLILNVVLDNMCDLENNQFPHWSLHTLYSFQHHINDTKPFEKRGPKL